MFVDLFSLAQLLHERRLHLVANSGSSIDSGLLKVIRIQQEETRVDGTMDSVDFL